MYANQHADEPMLDVRSKVFFVGAVVRPIDELIPPFG
jgi:hypothetical protein